MDQKKTPTPYERGELRDPKLPVIRGAQGGNTALRQIHSAPIPQPPKAL